MNVVQQDLLSGSWPMRQWQLWLTIGIILAGSVLLHLDDPTPDVSWLITMCERIWAGETAYVDILETTPPVPTLIYMPAVIAADIFGGTAERAQILVTYLSGVLTLGLTAQILPFATRLQSIARSTVLLVATVVLFVVPSDSFAQREYFAAMFALPIVAVFIAHAETGKWGGLRLRMLAALLAGLAVAIKPPIFFVPGGVLALYYWWRTRSLAFLLPSCLIPASIVAVALTGLSLAMYPHYFGKIWELMRDVYVPAKSHPLSFLADTAALGTVVALIATLALQFARKWTPPASLLLVVGVTFLGIYFMQGKFFSYHVFPAALFIALALAVVCVERISTSGVRGSSLVVFGAIFLLGQGALYHFMQSGFTDTRGKLRDLTWAENLETRTALAISPDIATSFPLSRKFDAQWINRTHSQWVARYTRYLLTFGDLTPEQREIVSGHYRDDLTWILDLIGKKKPSIILVDTRKIYTWLLDDLNRMRPGFLDGYAVAAEGKTVRVLVRNSP